MSSTTTTAQALAENKLLCVSCHGDFGFMGTVRRCINKHAVCAMCASSRCPECKEPIDNLSAPGSFQEDAVATDALAEKHVSTHLRACPKNCGAFMTWTSLQTHSCEQQRAKFKAEYAAAPMGAVLPCMFDCGYSTTQRFELGEHHFATHKHRMIRILSKSAATCAINVNKKIMNKDEVAACLFQYATAEFALRFYPLPGNLWCCFAVSWTDMAVDDLRIVVFAKSRDNGVLCHKLKCISYATFRTQGVTFANNEHMFLFFMEPYTQWVPSSVEGEPATCQFIFTVSCVHELTPMTDILLMQSMLC